MCVHVTKCQWAFTYFLRIECHYLEIGNTINRHKIPFCDFGWKKWAENTYVTEKIIPSRENLFIYSRSEVNTNEITAAVIKNWNFRGKSIADKISVEFRERLSKSTTDLPLQKMRFLFSKNADLFGSKAGRFKFTEFEFEIKDSAKKKDRWKKADNEGCSV